ncbi:hypothetical protein PUN28_002186 [Cardiocondyla obscurior]|uniref:Uncharacterized protein n=1 Tax=Cardiocondyla obscurior TaxID=286306 RepID=A0AAW2GT12_9HYME
MLLASEIHVLKINNIIKGNNIKKPEEHINDKCADDEMTAEASWATWAENVFIEAKKHAKVSYNKFRGLQIAISSFVEAEFTELKTRVFQNQLPMRVDKFIFQHIEYLNNKLSCALSKKIDLNKAELNSLKNYKEDNVLLHVKNNQIKKNRIYNNGEQTPLNEIENWRCKIKREASEKHETYVLKRSKLNYLTPCADWDFSNTNRTVGLPVLKNDSRTCLLQQNCHKF